MNIIKLALTTKYAIDCDSNEFLYERPSTINPLFLAASEAKRGKADPFVGYRAGGLRALVCGEEAAMGTYPILRSYTSLLAAAIKVSNCRYSSKL